LLALVGAHHILHGSRIGVCGSSLLRWRKPEEMLTHMYVHSEIGLGISGVATGDCKIYGTCVVISNGFTLQVCFLRACSP
jgi:hypothetical protein